MSSENKSSPESPEIEGTKDNAASDAEELKTYDDNDFEIFKKTTKGVDFRTVSWPKTTVIFLKVIFATGVLTIPTAMYSLGAVGGALSVIGWAAFITYTAVIQGNFWNSHAHCHGIADMAQYIGGTIAKEIIGFLFIAA